MRKERVLWGFIFVLAGVFLIVSKLGYFPDVNPFNLILTFFLVVIIGKSIVHLNFPGILFPLAFICIIYDNQLGITAITPWTVLMAALFGSIGLSMLFHKQVKYFHHKSYYKHQYDDYQFEKVDVEDEGKVAFKSSFGASIKYINSDKFEQADLECSFGALKVYFDNAVMSKDNAVVKINASFSGVELYIPKSWRVEIKTNTFLGDVSEKNRNGQVITNTLTLIGDVSFSGVEIIYI